MVIGVLRSAFSEDHYYHFVANEYGYPKTINLTNVETDAGVYDDTCTRIFIGEAYRYDVVFYPACLVKSNSSKSTPLSINRNKYCIEYDRILFVDGYGNEKWVSIPSHFDLAGIYEDKMEIEVLSRDIHDRDEICSNIMFLLVDAKFESLKNAGILISNVNTSYSDTEDRNQEKLYKASITFDSRGEWRRLIPIKNTIDHISLCIDFGNVMTGVTDPNFELNTDVNINDQTFQEFIFDSIDNLTQSI
jgi:hypothetical protein